MLSSLENVILKNMKLQTGLEDSIPLVELSGRYQNSSYIPVPLAFTLLFLWQIFNLTEGSIIAEVFQKNSIWK